MSAPATFASEPFTPRGVAAFAHARLRRLLLAQTIVALIAAGAVVWFLDDALFPIVHQAIQNLPDAGEVRSGQLNCTAIRPSCSPKDVSSRSMLT